MLKFNQGVKIENPRAYEASAVRHLQYLLETGSPVDRDPRRENFYEVDGGTNAYYIHISPVSGNVVLLAKWIRQSQECHAPSGHLVASHA